MSRRRPDGTRGDELPEADIVASFGFLENSLVLLVPTYLVLSLHAHGCRGRDSHDQQGTRNRGQGVGVAEGQPVRHGRENERTVKGALVTTTDSQILNEMQYDL